MLPAPYRLPSRRSVTVVFAHLRLSQNYFEDLTSVAALQAHADLRRLLPARLFFGFVVCGNLFKIVGFEDLTALDAVHVVDPVAPHQEFRANVLTAGHTKLS